MRGIARDDGGQLMLLAGIIVTSAFILTALTLSQVSSLERQAASDKPSPLAAEWRFLHDRLGTNLATAISPDLPNATFESTTFPSIIATFRNIEAEKGYDTVIRLAKGTDFATSEADLLDGTGTAYYATSDDGAVSFTHAYDLGDDGLLWQAACPDPDAAAGCIVGVYVYVRISDGASAMEETMLFAVNQG